MLLFYPQCHIIVIGILVFEQTKHTSKYVEYTYTYSMPSIPGITSSLVAPSRPARHYDEAGFGSCSGLLLICVVLGGWLVGGRGGCVVVLVGDSSLTPPPWLCCCCCEFFGWPFVARIVCISLCMNAHGKFDPISGHLLPDGQKTSEPAACFLIDSLEQGKQNLCEGQDGHCTK